jgi:hypothetical protein
MKDCVSASLRFEYLNTQMDVQYIEFLYNLKVFLISSLRLEYQR